MKPLAEECKITRIRAEQISTCLTSSSLFYQAPKTIVMVYDERQATKETDPHVSAGVSTSSGGKTRTKRTQFTSNKNSIGKAERYSRYLETHFRRPSRFLVIPYPVSNQSNPTTTAPYRLLRASKRSIKPSTSSTPSPDLLKPPNRITSYQTCPATSQPTTPKQEPQPSPTKSPSRRTQSRSPVAQ